jgi:hypothetical protein
MHRDEKDGRVLSKSFVGAVSIVYVKVKDENLLKAVVLLGMAHGNGGCREDAKAKRPGKSGVVARGANDAKPDCGIILQNCNGSHRHLLFNQSAFKIPFAEALAVQEQSMPGISFEMSERPLQPNFIAPVDTTPVGSLMHAQAPLHFHSAAKRTLAPFTMI